MSIFERIGNGITKAVISLNNEKVGSTGLGTLLGSILVIAVQKTIDAHTNPNSIGGDVIRNVFDGLGMAAVPIAAAAGVAAWAGMPKPVADAQPGPTIIASK